MCEDLDTFGQREEVEEDISGRQSEIRRGLDDELVVVDSDCDKR